MPPRKGKRASKGASAGVKALKMVKTIKKKLATELKLIDGSGTLSTSGSVALWSTCAQGDGLADREGNQVKSSYLDWRGFITSPASEPCTVRCLVVQDKQQIADTAPSITDVLDSTGFTVNNNYNELNVGRFKILRDKTYTINPGSAGVVQRKFVRFHIKNSSIIRFNGSATTDIQKNGIYFMWAWSVPSGACTMEYTHRFAFYDN